MELTPEIVARYVGGQLEAQNSNEGYLYRGEIATITIEGEGDRATLKVTLSWMASGEGFPPLPSRWVNDDRLTYDASLMIYFASDIDDGRIALSSPLVGETTVLYPPDATNRLDPSKVEGLNLESGRPEAGGGTAIIRLGPLYCFTARLPARHTQTRTLILPEAVSRTVEFPPESSSGSVDILYSDDGSYFWLLIESGYKLAGDDRNRFVNDVLRHAWDGLVGFGIVSGDMPEPIEGDPRRML